MALTVLAFLFVLVLLILAHEAGHFFSAKAFKVRVLEFGLGYPPRLWALRKGGVEYSVNALPLGGFVRLVGEEDPSDPQSLARKGLLTRFTVLSSGAFMNTLLAIFIFSLLFMIPQVVTVGQTRIKEVVPGSPAALAGLQPGDVVLRVDGRPVDSSVHLAYLIRLRLGAEMEWLVQRGPAQHTVYLTPRWRAPEGQGPTGIVVETVNLRQVSRAFPPWQAVPMGMERMWQILVLVKNEITAWVLGTSSPQLLGPIGIAQVSGEVARAGWIPLLEFTGLLSVNLAILNLLPIPMLDGGRLLFLAIEWVRRGRRVSPQRERLVHFIGFLILIMIVAMVSYNDILRIFRGGSLLP